MCISKLINIIEEYDMYLEHRINGLKAVYVLLVLFIFNMVYTIPNPYFNYFYLPITALGAEVIGETVKAKHLLFFYTVFGSIVSVFLFNITIVYPILFLFFVFFYSLLLYFIALHYLKILFVPVPLILSLAIYSLVYGQTSTNFYVALNNGLVTLLAMLIIMASLLFFPLKYYLRAWQRALKFLLKQILINFELIHNNQEIKIELVQPHLIMMFRYANMLPRKIPVFKVLKINLLMNELRLLSCANYKYFKTTADIEQIIKGLSGLIYAVEQKTMYKTNNAYPQPLGKLITTWNSLCCKI